MTILENLQRAMALAKQLNPDPAEKVCVGDIEAFKSVFPPPEPDLCPVPLGRSMIVTSMLAGIPVEVDEDIPKDMFTIVSRSGRILAMGRL